MGYLIQRIMEQFSKLNMRVRKKKKKKKSYYLLDNICSPAGF